MKDMDTSILNTLSLIAPDLMEEMELRTLILERVAALEPIGRRALAARLHLAEREVRAAAEALKRAGWPDAERVGYGIDPAGAEFGRGGADGQQRTADIIGHRIVALADAGRRAGLRRPRRRGHRFRGDGRGGARGGAADPLPFTGRACDGGDGGQTVAKTAEAITVAAPMEITVVPAQGGMGGGISTQANTVAERFAQKLGGYYRFLHLPDGLSEAAADELARLPQVREPLELVRHADVLLYGIGRAMDLAQRRGLSRRSRRRCAQKAQWPKRWAFI